MFCSRRSVPRFVLGLVLAATMFATGCTGSWINVALADLPVLVQMALNIAGLVSVVGTGQQVPESELAAITNISNEANKDLSLLQTLFNLYKANPSKDTLAQIEQVIAEINTNLPALLAAGHIKDPVLAARVDAAVQLILTTVTAFAQLIPQPTNPVVVGMKASRHKAKPPTPEQLKLQWNEKVAPQFTITASDGFWHRLGNAIGEAKFGS